MAKTNFGPAPAVPRDYLMLNPPEMGQLGYPEFVFHSDSTTHVQAMAVA